MFILFEFDYNLIFYNKDFQNHGFFFSRTWFQDTRIMDFFFFLIKNELFFLIDLDFKIYFFK